MMIKPVLLSMMLLWTLNGPTEAQTVTKTFHPLLGVCTSVANHEVVAAAGFDYIEEGVQRFLVPLSPDSVFREKLELVKQSSIPVLACNGFLPGTLKSTGPETHHNEILAYADTAFRRARAAGVRVIVFGSSGSRNYPDGFDPVVAREQFVRLLTRMGPVAAKYDMLVAIEPLRKGESNLVNRVSEGLAITQLVNHPNIRLLADIYHMLQEDEDASSIREANTHLIHCHIAEKMERTSPGTRGDNFYSYLSALATIGYAGMISLEGKWGDDFATELIRAHAYLRGQINTLH